MIQETLSNKQRPALTSDRWHVVHARWSRNPSGRSTFLRSIVSEHEDRDAAVRGARELVERLAAEMAVRPLSERDQLFVRKPGFRSLKTSGRVERGEK
jgi:hypothetical protein